MLGHVFSVLYQTKPDSANLKIDMSFSTNPISNPEDQCSSQKLRKGLNTARFQGGKGVLSKKKVVQKLY